MKKQRKRGKKSLFSIIFALICAFLYLFFGDNTEPGKHTNSYLSDGEAYVHIIDVGQGSATLIQEGNRGILIDTGEDDYGDYVECIPESIVLKIVKGGGVNERD